ncbi:MAG: DEAD/DEAH box helicase family protein [Bacteroides sp.]|nr:DEAD/DEAH box helicase family protein [Bacteroides sp.]MBO5381283.1 DEAD/DEAH box helicase family protein [Bacteroides sp.]
MPPRRNVRTARVEPKLSNALLLNRFMLSLFGATSLEALSEHLKDPALEGYDENNVSLFYHEICSRLFPNGELTEEKLLEYDQNIYRHTEHISKERGERIHWKYFQYLSLLFTEVYLDRYFTNRDKLLNDIQEFQTSVFNLDNRTYHEMDEFTANDLNKLAYWSATGSGKTLLMHVNILQFKHYAKGKMNINRTILITPNAGLTMQHTDEFHLSSIEAGVFSKKLVGGLFDKEAVDIIEITKLSETDGDKTVAVESFESNNLVLVDEGHRGSSGDVWKTMRDKLSAEGFAFEYSATFGQAVSSQSNASKKKAMLNEYGRATLFDYSYRYFYNDGYGKDYQILNMSDAWNELSVTKYLIACLLGFYEQTRLYIDKSIELTPFNLEKPLAIFVGGSVTANGGLSTQEISDVVYLLKFFEKFVGHRTQSIEIIDTLLNGTDGLVDKRNNPIFTRSLRYVRSLNLSAETIYSDMLKTIFNSEVAGATLHLDNLKGIDGEIGMRVGNGEYFGIINVGDSAGVIRKCEENGISTMTMDYSEKSLFATINKPKSTLNILIGSKKFTEGWSSWRVSTMGLLNVGRSEGSQIIQLFGRGVRLKGYKYSLKRSSALDSSIAPDKLPKHINTLETLNIFGIRADYMELFKMILQEEGLPTNDSDFIDMTIPVMPTVNLADKKLKYLKVKEGKDFKKEIVVNLNTHGIGYSHIILDYYPRILAIRSKKTADDYGSGSQNLGYFTDEHLCLLDWNKVFFDVVNYKNERSWYNLDLSLETLKALVANNTWYRLFIPEFDMQFTDFARCVSLWQEIVTTLLKMYVDRVYNNAKSKWMAENVEVAILDDTHPNFEKEYSVVYHRDLDFFAENLNKLKSELADKSFARTINISNSNDFQALYFAQHLYQPLLYINYGAFGVEGVEKSIKIAPVPLNGGEKDFVSSVKLFYDNNPEFFADKSLYLLRNKSKQGIGFFDVHGFYPDFLVWLVVGNKQYITFVDPKGIRQLRSFDDPKIQLSNVIRTEIEPRLNDADITLNSFIISNTSIREVSHWAGYDSKALLGEKEMMEFNKHHVYFQYEQSETYVKKMLEQILQNN